MTPKKKKNNKILFKKWDSCLCNFTRKFSTVSTDCVHITVLEILSKATTNDDEWLLTRWMNLTKREIHMCYLHCFRTSWPWDRGDVAVASPFRSTATGSGKPNWHRMRRGLSAARETPGGSNIDENCASIWQIASRKLTKITYRWQIEEFAFVRQQVMLQGIPDVGRQLEPASARIAVEEHDGLRRSIFDRTPDEDTQTYCCVKNTKKIVTRLSGRLYWLHSNDIRRRCRTLGWQVIRIRSTDNWWQLCEYSARWPGTWKLLWPPRFPPVGKGGDDPDTIRASISIDNDPDHCITSRSTLGEKIFTVKQDLRRSGKKIKSFSDELDRTFHEAAFCGIPL